MKRTWILAASASSARCFERTGSTAQPELLTRFACPQGRSKGVDLVSDRSGYEAMGPGRGSASFSHRAAPRAKVREQFAGELARFLSAGIAAHRASALVLVAPRSLLGRIKAHLSAPARKALIAAVGKDWMGLDSTQLRQRICSELPRTSLE